VGEERLYYIDNLRVLIILQVVAGHVAAIYSGIGLGLQPALPPMEMDIISYGFFAFFLGSFQTFNMPLLFLFAGYFTRASYDQKGFGPFIKARFIRLMIPALIVMAVLTPFQYYIELGRSWFDPEKGIVALIYQFFKGNGVLWFTVALFFFSLIYALVRRFGGWVPREIQLKISFPGATLLLLFIALCSFLVRLILPIGSSYILGMSLWYFPSYIAFFILGLVAERSNLLRQIRYKTSVKCLVFGIVLGILVWVGIMLLSSTIESISETSGSMSWQKAPFAGGWNWPSTAFALWESAMAIVLTVGLIGVFREKFNHQGKLGNWLSDNSFAVYVFHLQILIAIALLVRPIALPPVVKWIVMSVICLPVCYAAAQFVFRKIPLLKRIL
jgi:fucose 4-O-acetylase-like acetyltransferase